MSYNEEIEKLELHSTEKYGSIILKPHIESFVGIANLRRTGLISISFETNKVSPDLKSEAHGVKADTKTITNIQI